MPACAGGRELVADALADHLALELREAEQDVQRQPAHEVVVLNDWVTETKVTSCRSNTSTSLAKSISERLKPVDLVDHDHVDPSGLDVGEQPLQRRALQRAAGEAAVVVAVRDQHPALGPLAGHVGLAGLALGVEAS